ncbi:MAG: hypothetical protein JXR77_01940, partial [Lentisphaeria bacterium]|nr:hypothetical protein [Lentisphaeria bacterium]
MDEMDGMDIFSRRVAGLFQGPDAAAGFLPVERRSEAGEVARPCYLCPHRRSTAARAVAAGT